MWGSYEGAYICQTADNQIWRNYVMWFEKRLIKIQKNYVTNYLKQR